MKSKALNVLFSHSAMLLWMLLIFVMSAQVGDDSGELSGGVSRLFMRIWNLVFFRGWDESTIIQMAELWDFPIRKLAHMTEFGILALFVYWAIGNYRPMDVNQKVRYVMAALLSVFYACSDEFHQLFVPGRAGSVVDVLVDSCGIAAALLLYFGITTICFKLCRTASGTENQER